MANISDSYSCTFARCFRDLPLNSSKPRLLKRTPPDQEPDPNENPEWDPNLSAIVVHSQAIAYLASGIALRYAPRITNSYTYDGCDIVAACGTYWELDS
jgi:hypothetical protein